MPRTHPSFRRPNYTIGWNSLKCWLQQVSPPLKTFSVTIIYGDGKLAELLIYVSPRFIIKLNYIIPLLRTSCVAM